MSGLESVNSLPLIHFLLGSPNSGACCPIFPKPQLTSKKGTLSFAPKWNELCVQSTFFQSHRDGRILYALRISAWYLIYQIMKGMGLWSSD